MSVCLFHTVGINLDILVFSRRQAGFPLTWKVREQERSKVMEKSVNFTGSQGKCWTVDCVSEER